MSSRVQCLAVNALLMDGLLGACAVGTVCQEKQLFEEKEHICS